jgi:hypothetical protein
MKRAIIICFVMALSNGLFAQNDKFKIHASVAGFFNGLSLVNEDTLKYFSTTDFQLLEDGEVWTIDTLMNKMSPRKNSNVKRINKFEFIQTEQSGNMAWVSYHNTAQFILGEKQQVVRWLESAVLVKAKGRWKIQLLHSTKVK